MSSILLDGPCILAMTLILVVTAFYLGRYSVGLRCSHGPRCVYCKTSQHVLEALEDEALDYWYHRREKSRRSPTQLSPGWGIHPDGGAVWYPDR